MNAAAVASTMCAVGYNVVTAICVRIYEIHLHCRALTATHITDATGSVELIIFNANAINN